MKNLILFFLLSVSLTSLSLIQPVDEREIGWNVEVSFPVYAPYTDLGVGIKAARVIAEWDSAHFDFVGVTQGPQWAGQSYLVLTNVNETGRGKLTSAYAGTAPLEGDSLMFTLRLRSKQVSTIGTIESVGMFNEIPTPIVRIYEYRIDESLPVDLVWFAATINDDLAFVKWRTASEVNAANFVLEAIPYIYEGGRWIPEATFYKTTVPAQGSDSNGYSYNVDGINLLPGMYQFKLTQIDFDGTFEVYTTELYEVNLTKAGMYVYPNPANPSFAIQVVVPRLEHVTIDIYNVEGRRMATLFDASISGVRTIFTDTELPSGVYFVVMKYGEQVLTRKFVQIK